MRVIFKLIDQIYPTKQKNFNLLNNIIILKKKKKKNKKRNNILL